MYLAAGSRASRVMTTKQLDFSPFGSAVDQVRPAAESSPLPCRKRGVFDALSPVHSKSPRRATWPEAAQLAYGSESGMCGVQPDARCTGSISLGGDFEKYRR